MRLEQLTFTRFLAAIIIVVFHFGLDIPPFTHPSISFLFSNVGISYFFVLSGFVMIIAYSKSGKSINPKTYFKNRFARVYPVYLIALLLSILMMWNCNIPIPKDALIFNFTMLQSWFPSYPMLINRTGWTLSVEVLFYLSFPFLFNRVYSRYKLATVAVWILLFWLISQMLSSYLQATKWNLTHLPITHNLLYYFPLMHFNQFLIGNLFGILLLHSYERFSRNWDWLVIVLLALTAALLKYQVPDGNYHNGFLAILFGFIILIISLNNGLISRINNHKLLVFLGEISFGIYILQIPIHEALYKITKPFYYTQPTNFFYVYLCVLVLISAISYQLIETPLRKLIRRL